MNKSYQQKMLTYEQIYEQKCIGKINRLVQKMELYTLKPDP